MWPFKKKQHIVETQAKAEETSSCIMKSVLRDLNDDNWSSSYNNFNTYHFSNPNFSYEIVLVKWILSYNRYTLGEIYLKDFSHSLFTDSEQSILYYKLQILLNKKEEKEKKAEIQRLRNLFPECYVAV